jgi:hypothetical protein
MTSFATTARWTLVSAALMTGCFAAHRDADDGTSDDDLRPPPPIARDAGPALSDAGPGRADAGRTDAGPPIPPGCFLQPLDVACPTAPIGVVGHTIEVAFGGEGECFCGETVGCVASLRHDSRGALEGIDLNTYLCVGGALCDACFPFVEGTCELPPLPEGDHTVWIDGERAFEVATLAAPHEPPPPRCLAVGDLAPHECSTPRWPPVDVPSLGVACHMNTILPEQRLTIDVREDCASCYERAGPCEVVVNDDTLFVHPTKVVPDVICDDGLCPEVCMPLEHTCVTPRLAEGDYQVVVDGTPTTRVSVGGLGFFEPVCGTIDRDG